MIYSRIQQNINDVLRAPEKHVPDYGELPLVRIQEINPEQTIYLNLGADTVDREYPVENHFYIQEVRGHTATQHRCLKDELPTKYNQLLNSIRQEVNA